MSYGTIIQQGRFTADGSSKNLSIRSDFDWIKVYNETAIIQAAADLGAEFYFQRGMTNGRGMVNTKLGAVANDPMSLGQIADGAGFTLLDTSGNPLGESVAITSSTDVPKPIFTVAAAPATGTILRFSSVTGQEDLSGYDFQIEKLSGTTFDIGVTLKNSPAAPGTGGNYRVVNFDPLYYPRHRYIANISKAANAVVNVTVASGYKVGQKVRVVVPTTAQAGTSDYGMVEINGLVGTITAVNDAVGTRSVTLDIDSSAFTAFKFPTAAQAAVALSKAMLVPVGIDTAKAIAVSNNLLSDATNNQGLIGVKLAAGNLAPAGNANDVIYWVAGKSFSVDNQ